MTNRSTAKLTASPTLFNAFKVLSVCKIGLRLSLKLTSLAICLISGNNVLSMLLILISKRLSCTRLDVNSCVNVFNEFDFNKWYKLLVFVAIKSKSSSESFNYFPTLWIYTTTQNKFHSWLIIKFPMTIFYSSLFLIIIRIVICN